MLIAGLTGGIASGKSLVAKELARLGAWVIDADVVARQVMETNDIRQELWKAFGQGIFRADGSVDRQALGEIVFDDQRLRERLNSIVHPRVIAKIESQIETIRRDNPQAIVVLDVPLLIEAGMQRMVDKLIVVSAGEDAQIKRLTQRNGLTHEQAINRIKAQLPMQEKIVLADYVIENNGAPAETIAKVRQIYAELNREAGL